MINITRQQIEMIYEKLNSSKKGLLDFMNEIEKISEKIGGDFRVEDEKILKFLSKRFQKQMKKYHVASMEHLIFIFECE